MATTCDVEFTDVTGGNRSLIYATHQSGLTNSAAWRGVNYIADSLMKVPCYLRRYTTGDMSSSELVMDHPAFRLLKQKANPWMTAGTWKHLATMQAVWYGNHVSWIERAKDEVTPIALWPIDPQGVALTINYATGQIKYIFVHMGRAKQVDPADVLHIFGFSNDGLWGVDFLSYARATLNHALATRSFSTKFFTGGANASGLLKFPPGITPDKAMEFMRGFRQAHESLDGSHSTIPLFEGIDYEKLTIAPEQAQMLETQDLNDRQVANLLKLPPSVVGVESSVAYASYEAHRQEVLDSGIDPWMVRMEEACGDKLLLESEKENFELFFAFDRRQLQRVNHKDYRESIVREVDSGLLTLNEGRGLLNRPPTDSDFGDRHRKQLNLGYIEDVQPPKPVDNALALWLPDSPPARQVKT